MTELQQAFLRDSEDRAFDEKHRAIMSYNMSCYDGAVKEGKKQFANLELARQRAALRKHQAVEQMEDLLKVFEQQFSNNGGRVLWAEDAATAVRSIVDILEQHGAKRVVKSKSMVTEELKLTHVLEKNGIECVETDLGEFIVQITGDRPYHIITPVMHRSAEDIAGIFHEKYGLHKDATPEEITAYVRDLLREKFLNAQAGITGANFLVADRGAIALTENEGNGVLSMGIPNIHIAVAGIERIIPSIDDLGLFWPLLSTFGTGQRLSAYNSLVSGPRGGEEDGPEHMYVILLDNGRTRLLAETPQRRALSCIRCGACLNACPVYRHIGGHAYGTVYSGPIGAVISPHLSGRFNDYKHLSYASSLCGRCSEVCPVHIDLHRLLLHNRRLAVQRGLADRFESRAMWAYKIAMKKRKRLDRFSHKTKNFVLKKLFSKAWGPRRELPLVQESFARRQSR